MEFLYKNIINTTTQIAVDSNTLSAANILSRNITKQWISDGHTGATTSTITFTFDSTQTVSKLVFMGMNWKAFNVYYDGATANAFTIVSGATTASQFANNSETSLFMTVSTVGVLSISIDIDSTIVSGSERALGYAVVSDLLMDFERIPASKNYKPKLNSEDVEHVLSDGGTRINYIDNKWSTQIKYKNLTQTFKDDLKDVYDLKDEFIFVAFPTMTGWDEVIFPCVWSGPFEFHEYSDDFTGAGFNGSITLKEVPT